MTTPLKLLSPGNRTLCSSDLPLKPTKVFCDNRNFSSKNFDPSKFSLVSSSSSFTGWSGVNMHRQNSRSANLWFCGYSREDQDKDSREDDSEEDVEENLLRREVEETLLRILASCEDSWLDEEENLLSVFESDEDRAMEVPTRFQMLIEGTDSYHAPEIKPITDVDYLQELLAIQKQGPRAIGFFGTRNMGFLYQELIEILSYAMVITGNHIFTSGASGTNAAVIRGALRAEKPELLTVILPQSLKMQPLESQELLSKVKYVVEKPCNDHLPLIESSRLCNRDIVSHVQQVICFAFRDSKLLLETCQEAKKLRKILTLFYLD